MQIPGFPSQYFVPTALISEWSSRGTHPNRDVVLKECAGTVPALFSNDMLIEVFGHEVGFEGMHENF